jgi:hypothetical protein
VADTSKNKNSSKLRVDTGSEKNGHKFDAKNKNKKNTFPDGNKTAGAPGFCP